MLGAYFWGYMVTQIPAGRISDLYGGKWVIWGGTLLNIIGALLIPVCSMAGYQYLIFVRILMGLAGGVNFAAFNVLISKWAPEEERTTIASIVFGGNYLGPVLAISSGGILGAHLGWESIFYIHGGLAVPWLILWAILISDSPDQNTFVSEDEKRFIADQRRAQENTNKVHFDEFN